MAQIIEFLKKYFIISVVISAVYGIGYYLVNFHNNDIAGAVFAMLELLGALLTLNIIFGIWFPKIVIKNYVKECNPEDYVTVYFYEAYHNGFSKVSRLHGDPSDVSKMQATFSFIDEDGNYITDKWFVSASDFENNRSVVCLGDYRYNIINENGDFMCAKDYPGMSEEILDGKVKVCDNESGVNFVDVQTGKEIWSTFKKELFVE